jgi:DNA-binding NarL/FixJ family response regulator
MLDDRWQSPDSGEPPGALLRIMEAASLAELSAQLDEIDVLVISPGELTGDDLGQAAQSQEGRLAVLLLADHAQAIQSLVGLPLHSWGVLPLDCNPEELTAAISALAQGLLVLSPALFSPALIRALVDGTFGAGMAEASPPLSEPLTPREIEVLGLLAQGLPNKQIASRLSISEHTVKFHVSSLYNKLGVANRTEAVRAGVQQGLISL